MVGVKTRQDLSRGAKRRCTIRKLKLVDVQTYIMKSHVNITGKSPIEIIFNTIPFFFLCHFYDLSGYTL